MVLVDRLGWLPVPLLGLVVFLIPGSQDSLVTNKEALLWPVLMELPMPDVWGAAVVVLVFQSLVE